MKENLGKQISLDAIKYLEREPDAFVLYFSTAVPPVEIMQLDSFCSSFRYIGEISWNERLFICYVRGMWLNGTRKMRLFAKENQDIRKISPTFFLRLIFMLELRMSCLIGLLTTNHIIAYITMAYRGF